MTHPQNQRGASVNFYQFPSEVKPGFITPELAQHLTVLFRECQRAMNMTFSPPLHDADPFGNRCITLQTDSMFGPGGNYEFGPNATLTFDSGDTINVEGGNTWNFGGPTTNNSTLNFYFPSIIYSQEWTWSSAAPPAPTVAPTISLASGSWAGTTGNYYFKYTWVSSNGSTESGASPESLVTTLTNGSFGATITVPALPDGVASWNGYMTAAGGASGTETLQFTGKTGTSFTYNGPEIVGVSPPSSPSTTVPASSLAPPVIYDVPSDNPSPTGTFGDLRVLPVPSSSGSPKTPPGLYLRTPDPSSPNKWSKTTQTDQAEKITGLYTFTAGIVFDPTTKWPSSTPANGYTQALGCGLAIQNCGTTGVIPTITMSPLLKTAQIFLPLTSTGTGTRTDDSPYQINLSDVSSNVNSTDMTLGKAATFTGTVNQALATTALPSWNGQTALTVFARFKFTDFSNGTTVFTKGTVGGTFRLTVDGTNKNATFTVSTSAGAKLVTTSNGTVVAGVEYAAMCWYDASAQTVNINLNGTTYTTSAIGLGTTLTDSSPLDFVVGNDDPYALSASMDGSVQNVFVSLAVPTASDLTTWAGAIGYPTPGGPGQFIKNLSTGATVDTIHESDNSPGAKMAVQAALGGV